MSDSYFSNKVSIFLIGGLLATLLPTPMDVFHFMLQNYLFTADISQSTYTLWQIFDWYFLDSLWYLALLIVALVLHIKKVSTIKQITIMATIISVGVLIGILTKYIFF